METQSDSLTVRQCWAGNASPVDRSPIHDWTARNINVPPASPYTITGRLSFDHTRHWIGPLDALQDEYVRTVTVLAPPRSGKNVIADAWLPFVVANDPGPFMWVGSIDNVTSDYKRDRLDPILWNTPAVARLLPADSNDNTKRKIMFRHGMSFYIHGPSIANLQTKGIRYQVRDELWLWSDRFAEADARLGDYDAMETSKALTISQGGVADDALDMEWRQSSQHVWHVQCSGCGAFMPPAITGLRDDGSRWGLKWDRDTRDELGDWDLSKVLPTVRFECRECGHVHIDSPALKQTWNRVGKYVQTNDKAAPKFAGFRINNVPLKPWADIVTRFCEAQNAKRRGDIEPLRTFTQKDDALPFSERNLAAVRKTVVYDIKTDWPEETHRFLTVDTQAEWFWVTARAWSATTGRTRRLHFSKQFGFADIAAVAAELSIPLNHVFIDAGYRAKGDTGVYAACCDYGWLPLKGNDREFFLHTVRQGRRSVARVQRSYSEPVLVDSERGMSGAENAERMCHLLNWSTPSMYSKLQGLIDKGLWEDPAESDDPELEEQYRRQMASTIRKEVRGKRGKTEVQWATIDRENHAWDLAAMQVLAAVLNDIVPDFETTTTTTEP